jgi:hypothetical protein
VITDKAVTAAAKVIYADNISNHAGDNAPQIIDACERVARKVLEAASPHLMANALSSAAQAMELMPPMVRAHYVETLRLYASEPWRLETCPSECAAKHPGKEHAV